MEWLWIILRYLFPLDPVRQCIAALCDRVGVMVQLILNDDALDELAADPDARIALEAALIDYEATLRLTIAARAHQIAKLRFIPGRKSFHRPARARSLVALVKRIRSLALDCADIERLAQLQAVRLKREREADPLGLAAHGSTDAALRAAAHHEPVDVSRKGSPIALMVSSAAMAARPSNHERVLTAVANAAGARAPPVFDVYPLPNPASEAQLLRSHPHPETKKARRSHRAFFIQSIKQPKPGSSPGRDSAQQTQARPRCAAAGCTSQAGPTAPASPS